MVMKRVFCQVDAMDRLENLEASPKDYLGSLIRLTVM